MLTSSEVLQPNEWVTVRVERHRQDGTLILNNGIAVKGTLQSRFDVFELFAVHNSIMFGTNLFLPAKHQSDPLFDVNL